ncbi:hypothetical protein [Micropruina sp.]
MGVLMETAAAHDANLPWIIGGTIFFLLLVCLRVVWGVGKSRPHC